MIFESVRKPRFTIADDPENRIFCYFYRMNLDYVRIMRTILFLIFIVEFERLMPELSIKGEALGGLATRASFLLDN